MSREQIMNRIRYFNRLVTNPITMTFAGKRVYAVIHHVGRRSGRLYRTPVLAMPIQDGFVIPLPYGRHTDWCQNVLEMGSFILQWQQQAIKVIDPELTQRLLRHTGQYLKVVRL